MQSEARSRVLYHAVATVWQADRRGTIIAGVLQVVGALSGLGVVLASKLALEAVLAKSGGDGQSAAFALVLLATASAVTASVAVVQQLQQRLLAARVDLLLWDRLLRTSVGVDLITWQSPAFVLRLDRVTNNAFERPTAVVSALFLLAGSVTGTLGLVAALVAIQPLLVPVLVSVAIPSVLLARLASRHEYRFAVTSNRTLRESFYLKGLLSSRTYAAEIRAFDSGPHLLGRHAHVEQRYIDGLRQHVRRRQRIGLASTVFGALALTLTLLLIILMVNQGAITLAEAGAAAIGARLLGGQLSGVFASVSGLIESGPFLQDMAAFYSEATELASPVSGRSLASALTVRQASFSYEGAVRPAISSVSITVPRGRVIALVGENGSGKSTLAKLVAGLYSPTSGTVAWDGDTSIPAHELRAGVSVLFQDFAKYQMSGRDNITIADTARPPIEDDVQRSARNAGIDQALASLPQGYDTMLGLELAEGSDLSGGQWQRLALARAFYRDTPVIVLDEPTASMDPQAEHALFQDVRTVLGGRAALLISHRYSSVRLADYIYVLHEGRIVEEGTHEDLMSNPTHRYARMFTLQAGAYA